MQSGSQNRPVPCERCGGATTLATRVPPVGQLAGAKVYECMNCKHQTWHDWRNNVSPPPMPQAYQPNANVQQQQQVQPKDDDKPEEKK